MGESFDIIIVAYQSCLVSLLTISTYLGEIRFVSHKSNPFARNSNVTPSLNKIWNKLASYLKDEGKRKNLIISTVFEWLFDKNALKDLQMQIPYFSTEWGCIREQR